MGGSFHIPGRSWSERRELAPSHDTTRVSNASLLLVHQRLNHASHRAPLLTAAGCLCRAITEQKQKMKRLGSDLSTAQKEMKAKHKAYENAVGVLSRRLQEALAAKESSEAELNELKARFSESENNQASLVSSLISLIF